MNKWLSNVALVLLVVALICVVGKNVKYSHIIQNGESTHIIHTGKGNVYTGLKINGKDVSSVGNGVYSTGNGLVVLGEVYSNGSKISINSGNSELQSYNRNFSVNFDDSLTFITNFGPVNIKPAKGEECTINIEGEVEHEPKLTTNFGFVELEFEGRMDDISIDIYIPKKMSRKLKVENVSGDIDYSAGWVQNLRFKTVSGDVYIKNEVPAEIDVDTVSGDINYQSPLKTSVEFDSVSGRCNTREKNDAQVYIEASTVSGDLMVR